MQANSERTHIRSDQLERIDLGKRKLITYAGSTKMTDATHNATVKKVFLRLMPVLFISYILAYIDRINIGFAALKMNTDLGISPYIYGLGAGVFFLGYFIFEIPSNLILEKTGARRWIARIMIS